MSLWGPALDAEIEYRHAEAKKAWGGKRTDRSDRAPRTEKRSARPSRTEQIKEGIAGMRPASTPRRGLFA